MSLFKNITAARIFNKVNNLILFFCLEGSMIVYDFTLKYIKY